MPAALVKDGVLDGTAAASLKPVDVFYIYPTVTGFRPETEVCEMTDTMMISPGEIILPSMINKESPLKAERGLLFRRGRSPYSSWW